MGYGEWDMANGMWGIPPTPFSGTRSGEACHAASQGWRHPRASLRPTNGVNTGPGSVPLASFLIRGLASDLYPVLPTQASKGSMRLKSWTSGIKIPVRSRLSLLLRALPPSARR